MNEIYDYNQPAQIDQPVGFRSDYTVSFPIHYPSTGNTFNRCRSFDSFVGTVKAIKDAGFKTPLWKVALAFIGFNNINFYA